VADSVRKQIVKKIEVKLKTIVGATVLFGTIEPNNDDRPLIGIIPLEDNHERIAKVSAAGKTLIPFQRLRVAIRVVVDEESEHAGYELEDLLAAIDALMEADRTWDGIAIDTMLIQDKWLYLDAANPQAGADKEYEIQFSR